MEALILVLVLISSLVSLVCAIMVVIKLFNDKGIWWGIFGIICGIYAFIWGWQNAKRFDLQKIMIIWSISIVFGLVLNIIATVSS
jgi:hypothetical protein